MVVLEPVASSFVFLIVRAQMLLNNLRQLLDTSALFLKVSNPVYPIVVSLHRLLLLG